MVILYQEQVGSRSPGNAGVAMDAQRATWPYFVTPDVLVSSLRDILGGTQEKASPDGRLVRQLPKAHPMMPWLYAEKVASIQGLGKPTTTLFPDTFEVGCITPKLAVYKKYLLTIEFSSRPYHIIRDEHLPIQVQAPSWKIESGVDAADEDNKFTREYLRYCDYDFEPDAQVVSSQHGTSIFRATGAPDGKTFPGMPKMTIARGLIRWRWYGIPARFADSENSYLLRYQGYINQLPWLNWKVGALLYRTFKILRRYPPPVPDENLVFGTIAVTPDKLIDVELYLEWTRRELASSPTPPPTNGNWITAGWNLEPWYLDRKFYYVTANNADHTKQYPNFPSFPVQLLFKDPDSKSYSLES